MTRFSVFLLFASLACTGCAHVAPHEREHLSDPSMDLEHEASEARFRAHAHDAREGATGGRGSTGGGCGCN